MRFGTTGFDFVVHARDEAEAIQILQAICVLRGGMSGEILVTPEGPAPTGHTHRELSDARRRGDLEAVVTARGLVFSQAALDAYRRIRTERRSRRRRESKPPVQADPDEARIRALESRGIAVRQT